MKVLADFHHHDLFESLQIVFRDRFGWDLFRPIGMDWFDEGYWNLERAWHGDAVARQYLTPWGDDEPGIVAMDGTTGIEGSFRIDRSHFVTPKTGPSDRLVPRRYRMLTLEQARAAKPDVVIASVAHNHDGLARFAREVGAKFGIHLGNVRFGPEDMAEDRWDLADFGILTSTSPLPPPKPHVTVHQEFSQRDFRHEPPAPRERLVVSSFVQCLAENRIGYAHFRATAGARPGFDWRIYGAYGSAPEDEYAAGNLPVCSQVGDAMRASDIAWHTKQWSDGFGHVIHDWFSVGRPVVGFEWYYRSQLAGPLWQEGVTTFDLTDKSIDETTAILDRLANDEDLRLRMGENAAARFREVVDFDADAEAIRRLIESIA